jgi:uncharacterized protein (TIGR01777 family)
MTETNDNRILLAGGSGFLGRLLRPYLEAEGWQVTVLSRAAAPGTVPWDGRTLGPWADLLAGAAALINLAGRSVNCRYTRRNRRAMMNSRIESTRILGQAIAASPNPPAVWLNASTATIYKHSLDRPMDELTGEIAPTPEAKDAFSIDIAQAWEAQLAAAPTPATRKVALRAAMVLAPVPGTVLPVLARLARWRLGGPMAGGRQYISWIHHRDFCRAVSFLLRPNPLAGPVNLAAPQPLPNAAFMAALRQHLGVRIGLPASRVMLEAGAFFLRTETELILKSRRVIPTRLLDAGFSFDFPALQPALRDLLR